MAKDLTPAQKVALGEVRAAREAQNRYKVRRRAELMEMLRQEGVQLEMTTGLAVRKAHDLGISLAMIGREGLGTSDPGTPRRFMQLTEAVAAATVDQTRLFAWIDDSHTTIQVNYPDFVDVWDHVEQQATDWPNSLRGVVRRDEEPADDSAKRSGWIVVSDGQGPNQWFTMMIEARSGTGAQGETLPVILSAWAAENS